MLLGAKWYITYAHSDSNERCRVINVVACAWPNGGGWTVTVI